MHNLGLLSHQAGRIDAALDLIHRAIALRPNFPEAYNNLGNALKDRGKLDDAVAAYRQAIVLTPNYAGAHYNLGNALKDKGELDQAIAAYRKAINFRPDFPEAHNNLASALVEKGQLDEALAVSQRAIALRPNYPQAHSNVGNALKGKGQLDEAIAAYRRAVDIGPSNTKVHSNLLYALLFHPAYTPQAIAREHRHWNQLHAQPLRKLLLPHSNERSPERRLRIGYVSPDFRMHVIGRHLLPLLERHDRRQFHIMCYSQVSSPDAMTTQLRNCVDGWCNIDGLSDEQAARQIREDRIDILVDLTLHMAGNRLLVFARKPAPVQVTYLAYAGSSGLTAMDYRLSDPYLDPPDSDLSCYTEDTVRLPRSYWCYQPEPLLTRPPAQAPASKNGFITFGCLNNFAKVSPAALDLWAKILLAVPHSRLLIHASAGTHRDDVRQRMERAGVVGDRLSFVGMQPWTQYMQTHSEIDIALDPFPYGGGITTCDAMWMGVPVVTLSGQTAVGRGGRSIISNLGLPDLIAFSQELYLQIAVALAQDQARLNDLHSGLRQRMLASPLMDAAAFARDMETAYREMWRAWCK